MNCCDSFGNCDQGRHCPVRALRRVKAYPHVPADLAEQEAIQEWRSLDKQLAWACWAFICTIGCVLLGLGLILILELL